MKKRKSLTNMILCAMFIATGILLPLVTANNPQLGKTICPMHIPVFICGAVCGWQWGMAAGIITPLLRAVIFPSPLLYPDAISMAFELATYGLIIGLLLKLLSGKTDRVASIYISLTAAMVVGRVVLAFARFALYGMFGGAAYTWATWVSVSVVGALPALVIQFAIIPPVIYAFGKYGGRRR